MNKKVFQIGLDTSLDILQVLSQVLTKNSRPKSGRDSGLDSLLKTWFGMSQVLSNESYYFNESQVKSYDFT